MKRLVSGILIFMIFIALFTVSFANESSNWVSLTEGGSTGSYRIVNLEIDGEAVKAGDVPPIIYESRTLVPLRMVIEHLQEKLNANIEWDGTAREAKIETREKKVVFKIDSEYAVVNGVQKVLPDKVSAKLLALNGDHRTMIPIRFFEKEFGIDIGWDAESYTASLKTPKIPEENPGEQPNPGPNPGPSIPEEDINTAYVRDVGVKMSGLAPQIRVEVSEKTDYKNFRMENPERIIIDLHNTRFNLRDKSKLGTKGYLKTEVNNGVVKEVRASQFKIPTGQNPDDAFVTRVVMELENPADYKINFDSGTKEFVIDLEPDNTEDNEDIIDNGNAGDNGDIKDDEDTEDDKDIEDGNDTEGDIDIGDNRPFIVIDPGHGGSDPGAVSPILDMKESDIVLDISLKLNRLLTEAGYRTYLTRVDNLGLTLQDRVDDANMLGADLFVSVHANAYTSSSVSGIETFYRRDDRASKNLAQSIQSEIINDLNMIDRGAKPANYYVLKHTTMPAALVETGFLSNPSDEAKLATDKYRGQIAKSIFEGIVRYRRT